MKRLHLTLVLALALALGGCNAKSLRLIAATVQVAAATAHLAAEIDRQTTRRHVASEQATYVYVQPGCALPPAPLPPASPRDRVPTNEGPRSFDPVVARVALSGVDLTSCRDAGVPSGNFGHAQVTFASSGNVERIAVDGPAGLSAEAVGCVGAALGRATVPPFRGSAVTVPTTWRVP